MTAVFLLALLIGSLLGLLAIWLIIRARAPAAAPAAVPANGATAGLSWIERVVDALDYLSTRREWRYDQPWVLLLGEQGAGKSSLIASIDKQLIKPQEPRDAQLSVAGTAWTLYNQGVLIDPLGSLPSAAAGTRQGKEWATILEAITALRPERPLDGLVLVVSAATLLHGDEDVRIASAENAYRQLCVLQDEIEFTLPVYVVITQADCIEGFSAFWAVQEAGTGQQMFGWSASALDANQSPEKWADAAFDSMGDELRVAQLSTLIEHEQIQAIDPFFLFPVRFEALRSAAGDWLTIAFRSTAWRTGFSCRGIWLAGSIEAQGAQAPPLRKDVSFINDLMTKKVWAEKYLANPTRNANLSRNRLIRGLQIACVAFSAALFLSLGIASLRVHHQVDMLDAELAVFKSTPAVVPGGPCPSRQQVLSLLASVRDLNVNSFYLAIPSSWFDQRLRNRSADFIATHVLNAVVLPGLACQLTLRANRLIKLGDHTPDVPTADTQAFPAYREGLFRQVRGVLALENALASYRRLTRPGSAGTAGDAVQDFAALVAYAYDLGPSDVTLVEGRGNLQFFNQILLSAHEETPLGLPDQMESIFAGQITRISDSTRVRLLYDVQAGKTLIEQLEQQQEPVLKRTRYLVWWLDWVRAEWLGSSAKIDPCSSIETDLGSRIAQLMHINASYESLQAIPAQFNNQQCSIPAHNALQDMQLDPYGALFTQIAASNAAQTSTLQMNPALVAEQQGLVAVQQLNFMQIEPTQGFTCVADASGWSSTVLDQVMADVRQYQGLSQRFGLPPQRTDSANQPLYNRIALYQLNKVMNSTLTDAQQTSADTSQTSGTSVGSVSALDQQLSQESSDLTRSQTQLMAIQQMYGQLGLVADRSNFVGCLRGFASEKLGLIQGLANQSLLYDPLTAPGDSSFFNLATTPVTADYLARQAARAQVLTSYATPFTSVLLNTVGSNDAQLSNFQSSAYWSNTIAEMNHHLQFKGQNDQVSYLEAMFLTQFPDLSVDNCAAQWKSYQPAATGNDLFSILRTSLEHGIQRRCEGGTQVTSANAWKPWLDRFNTELAGRFPFGPLSAPDASPAAVQAFFVDYAAQADKLKTMLTQLPPAQAYAVKTFAKQLDAANAFFAATLGTGAVAAPVHLNLTFRAAPEASPGSSQILSWLMQVGAQTAGLPNLATSLDWPFGQPLTLSLTWANRSLYTPVASVNQTDLRVDGLTASYSAAGDWALLRMMAAHQPHSVSASTAKSPAAVVLEFDVPVIGPVTAGGPVTPPLPVAASSTASSTASSAVNSASSVTSSSTGRPSTPAGGGTGGGLHAGVTPAFVALQLKGVSPTNGAPVPLSVPVYFPLAAPNL